MCCIIASSFEIRSNFEYVDKSQIHVLDGCTISYKVLEFDESAFLPLCRRRGLLGQWPAPLPLSFLIQWTFHVT